MKQSVIFTAAFAVFYLFTGSVESKTPTGRKADHLPVVSVWNFDHMVLARESLQKGEPTFRAPYNQLIHDAEQILGEPATSVMDKPDNKVAKSGDKHDFISVSKYCWPNPKTPDGMPWVYIDGIINVENFSKDDAVRQDKMCNNVVKLSLAWFFSQDDRFAIKALELTRVWFIDPSTRMNPHLIYAQVIPGTDNDMGHPAGIIFGRVYINVLAGLSLIKNSPRYNKDFDTGIKKWFAEYADWLTKSEPGIKEGQMTNNHSIAYDEQLLASAQLTGDEVTARRIVNEFMTKRVFPQVEPDGSQPRELKRNRALGYSAFNVKHMLEICEMARQINPSLYTEKSADGRCIGQAIDFIAAYLGKTVTDFAPYQQIEDWDKSLDEISWIVKWADKYDPEKKYQALFQKFKSSSPDNMNYLLY